jgi:hypothetical protein
LSRSLLPKAYTPLFGYPFLQLHIRWPFFFFFFFFLKSLKTFLGGSEANGTFPHVGVALKDVAIIGTDYHDDACTPCPAGFKSAANTSSCTACGIDHFSSAPDSEICTPCLASTTALHKATECVPRPPCTEADYIALYTECAANNTRTQYYTYLQPQVYLFSYPRVLL